MYHISWEIADKLRECDTVEMIDDILDVLFNKSYKSVTDRYNKMQTIIASMKEIVNPNYSKIISKISKENIENITENLKNDSCAPGYCI